MEITYGLYMHFKILINKEFNKLLENDLREVSFRHVQIRLNRHKVIHGFGTHLKPPTYHLIKYLSSG